MVERCFPHLNGLDTKADTETRYKLGGEDEIILPCNFDIRGKTMGNFESALELRKEFIELTQKLDRIDVFANTFYGYIQENERIIKRLKEIESTLYRLGFKIDKYHRLEIVTKRK